MASGQKAMRGRSLRFGSILVRAETGQPIWLTSLFPDYRSGSLLLPLKAVVRRREGLEAGRQASSVLGAWLPAHGCLRGDMAMLPV